MSCNSLTFLTFLAENKIIMEKPRIIVLKEFKEILDTYPEYDSEGEPTEIYFPSGKYMSSPLSRVHINGQGTIFLEHLKDEMDDYK